MRALFVGKTRNGFIQFFRYLFVGGIAAAGDAGALYLLYSWLGANYLVAAAIGFIFGLLINYAISAAWVFTSTGRFRAEFVLFAIIGVGGLGWTELIMWLGVHVAQAPVMATKAVALVLVLFWNFGMRKKFVFVRPPQAC